MEVSFPRGGRKNVFQKTTDNKEEDLFKVPVIDYGKTKKSKKKSQKKEKDDAETEIPVIIEQLYYQTLSEGMVVLGCIHEVLNYSVTVVLPGGIQGKVPITNISDSYTRLLQTFAENTEAVVEIVVSPTSMFTPGLCFPLKVVNKEGELGEKKKITLSMNPKDVNESLTNSCLYHQMMLLAAVESVEDHGYIMDVGIKGLQGFLSNSNAAAFIQKSHDGRPLAVGQPLMCQINMPNMKEGPLVERTLTLVAKHKPSEYLVSSEKPLNLHNLLPGIVVKGEVKMVRKDGLVVECHGFGGCVWRDHLKEAWDNTLKYNVGQEVDCMVLFQTPITHTLNLSLLPRPTPANLKKRYAGLNAGDLVEEATVTAVFNKSIYLKLPGNVKAIAMFDQLSDLPDVNVPNTFKVGDVHRCRILQFSHLDLLAKVSLKWSVLQQVIIPPEEMKVGAIFDGKVVNFVDRGMIVHLGKGLQGFVRVIHMADIPPTDPSKRFPLGKMVKCRILRIDQVGDRISPLLTCKKTLLKSDLPPLFDYKDAVRGCIVDGVVVKVNENGLVVTFYGSVQGWVPIYQASYEKIEHPEKFFYLGQVVKCRVLTCHPEEQKLCLSLKLSNPKTNSEKSLSKNVSPISADGSLKTVERFPESGSFYDVIVLKKTEDGLSVKVEPSGKIALLPTMHLSDHPKLCKLLGRMYSEGDRIKRVICFSSKGEIIISKKASLIQAAENNTFIRKFHEIQPGMILSGVVKTFMTYGLFVDLGSGIQGLAHLKRVSEKYIPHINNSGYVTHSSITVKVMKVFRNNKRLELSPKLKDVYDGNKEGGLSLLRSFLLEWNELISNSVSRGTDKDLSGFRVGTIVPATVLFIEDEGILCDLEGGVKGFSVSHHLGDLKCSKGNTYDALVVHVDVVNVCVELVLSPLIVKKSQLGTSSKVCIGQEHLGKILLIRDHFYLAFLDDVGSLAYLPVKRHMNDMVGNTYAISEEVAIKIARMEDGVVLGTVVKNSTLLPKRKVHVVSLDGNDLDENKQKNVKRKSLQKETTSEDIDSMDGSKTLSKENTRKRRSEEEILSKNQKKTKTATLGSVSYDCDEDSSESTGDDDSSVRDSDDENQDTEKKTKIAVLGFENYNCDEDGSESSEDGDSSVRDSGDERRQGEEADSGNEEHSEGFRLGDCLTATVTSVEKFQLNILIDGKTEGHVHVTEINSSVSEGVNPLEDFWVGQKIDVYVVGFRKIESHRLVLVSQQKTRSAPEFALERGFREWCTAGFQKGQELMGYVKEFSHSHSCLWVWLTPQKTGWIPLMDFSQNPNVLRNVEKRYPPSQAVKVIVVSSTCTDDPVELTRMNVRIESGRILLGLVLSAKHDLGVSVKLPGGYRGTIGLCDLCDTYKPASVVMEEMIARKFVRCRILEVDSETKTCRLSTRKSRFRKAPVDDCEIRTISALRTGSVLRGFLTSHSENRPNVTLGHDVKGTLPHESFPERVRPNLKECLPLGTVVRVRVERVNFKDGNVTLTLVDYEAVGRVQSSVGSEIVQVNSPETNKRNRTCSTTSEPEAKKKKSEEISPKHSSKAMESVIALAESDVPITDGTGTPKTELPRLQFSAGFDWDVEATPNLNSLVRNVVASSSDSEEDGEGGQQEGQKKKSKKQKQDEAREEEKKMFQQERRLMESDWQPETVDDFDRMVVSSPNNSLIWLKYMAFHLQQAEVEKARAVAERALKTICFRDEQEKLNVWVAMLNLENLYGTRDSLNTIFQRALQNNEPIKVYTHLAGIYDQSEKVEEAEEVHSTMIKKFRKNKDTWINFGAFYMKRSKIDAARQLMQRSLNSLEKRDHIDVISKFAQFEFKLGEAERGKTMFEGILSSYPKRIDLWSVYVDMLMKCGDVDAVRSVFERAITMSVPAKKMKFFFKRYLEFEQKQGNDERVREVQMKALEYVESKMDLE